MTTPVFLSQKISACYFLPLSRWDQILRPLSDLLILFDVSFYLVPLFECFVEELVQDQLLTFQPTMAGLAGIESHCQQRYQMSVVCVLKIPIAVPDNPINPTFKCEKR